MKKVGGNNEKVYNPQVLNREGMLVHYWMLVCLEHCDLDRSHLFTQRTNNKPLDLTQ